MIENSTIGGPSKSFETSCVPWGFWASTGFGVLAILAWLLFQWLAAAVILVWLGINAAPVMEELLFRGFLLRGYTASRLGPIGAVLLTSAAWASMHIQYEVFYVVQIFVLGCVFGWLRLRSGSTTLTLILHGIVNLTAIVQTVYIAELAG